MASGTTIVENLHHIDRGYERFDEKLRALGGNIIRYSGEAENEEMKVQNESHV